MNLQLLQFVLVMSITAHLVTASMFIALRRILPGKVALWWIGYSLSIATSYVLALFFFNKEPSTIGTIIFYYLNMLGMSCISVAVREFLGHTVDLNPLLRGLLVMLVGILFSLLIVEDNFIADLIFALFCSYVTFNLSVHFYKSNQQIPYLKNISALLLVIISIHWVDYPFLHTLEWFKPFGFLFAMLVIIIFSLLFSAQVLLRFQLLLLQSEQKAIYEATHDALTGLLNRSALEQYFVQLSHCAHMSAKPFAVIYIDLDGFKAINDNYGHHTGDLVLRSIAKRLDAHLQGRGIAARIGGDEFVLLAGGNTDIDLDGTGAPALTKKLLALIEQPIMRSNPPLTISASIGISLFPKDGSHLDVLLDKADKAMYRVKRERRRFRGRRIDDPIPNLAKELAAEQPDLACFHKSKDIFPIS